MASEVPGKGLGCCIGSASSRNEGCSASFHLTRRRSGTSGPGPCDPVDMEAQREAGKGGPQMQADQAPTAASTLEESFWPIWGSWFIGDWQPTIHRTGHSAVSEVPDGMMALEAVAGG